MSTTITSTTTTTTTTRDRGDRYGPIQWAKRDQKVNDRGDAFMKAFSVAMVTGEVLQPVVVALHVFLVHSQRLERTGSPEIKFVSRIFKYAVFDVKPAYNH